MEIKRINVEQSKELADFIMNVMKESKNLSKKLVKDLDNLKVIMHYTLNRDIENGTLECYGMIKDSQIIGMVGYEPLQSEIKYLYVHPNYQRQGIGTKLLDVITKSASSPIIAISSAHKNAVGMYEKYGFYKTGENTKKTVEMEYIVRR